MSSVIDSIISKITSIAGGDVIAVIVLILAVSFALSTAKNALKIVTAIIGVLAVLYLVNPDIYSTCLSVIDQIASSIVGMFKG